MTHAAAPDLKARLRDVHVGLREDLEVSRQVSRGEPIYVVHDPVSFQSHQFAQADYRILVSLNRHRSLSETFEALVADGVLARDREQEFYEFILLLHRNGFLSLPIADGSALYRRHKAGRAIARKRLWLSFVYLDIPIWNPDAFLDRTIRYFRPLFTWTAFCGWLVLILAALFVGIVRRRELAEPLTSLLAAQNLLIIGFTLAGLKFIHELGHAYACKSNDLRVPTLGVYLVAGIPCAYVDASASWGLSSRRKRSLICLAGMYFESIVAAVALFVWASTPPGLVNAVAYNIIFLAGVATVVFNINPLMKYDGYFVLCDLVQIPNLGQRAAEAVAGLAKRYLLGLPPDPKAQSASGFEKVVLYAYGLAAPVYRMGVLLAVSVLLASRFYTFGLILGTLYLGHLLISRFQSLLKYLWQAQETAPVRGRAVLVSACVLVIVPGLLAVLPIRSSLQVAGIAFAGEEDTLRAETPGFLAAVNARDGQALRAGSSVAQLENDRVDDRLAEARARLQASEVRREAYRVDQPARADAEHARTVAHALTVRERQQEQERLTVRASRDGILCSALGPLDIGRFIPAGGEIARLVSGPPELHLLVCAEELTSLRASVGQTVECRLMSHPGQVVEGVISRISPAGRRDVSLPGLTHQAGGDIVVEPGTGEAQQPYFTIGIRLDEAARAHLQHGGKAVACLPTRYEPIALHLYRRVARFVDGLQKS